MGMLYKVLIQKACSDLSWWKKQQLMTLTGARGRQVETKRM